jgi:hypothetical protein
MSSVRMFPGDSLFACLISSTHPDEDASNNIRHRRTPKRVPRRHKTLKRVEYVC